MHKLTICFSALFCILFINHASALSAQLGISSVTIATYGHSGRGYTYIHLHQNESTSLMAAKRIIAQNGGKIISLRYRGGRLISFRLHGRRYTFDPNRIFTKRGIRLTLQRYGTYSASAFHAVQQFSKQILHLLSKKLIIALHNNSKRYSILLYKAGQRYAHDVSRIYINPNQNPSNFFFVTNARTFNYLRQKGFNVLLQHPHATNDGSLSVYAARHGIPYINVEAEHGHLHHQIKMLKALQGL